MNKPAYLEELKQIAPDLAFSVSRKLDENFIWDGDGPDPAEQNFEPYDVYIKVRTVIRGEIMEGVACLGGSYYQPGEPLEDVHGYLPQLLADANFDLMSRIHSAGGMAGQTKKAAAFLKRLMRQKYDKQGTKAKGNQ